jgi:hypothetical protein
VADPAKDVLRVSFLLPGNPSSKDCNPLKWKIAILQQEVVMCIMGFRHDMQSTIITIR